MKRAIATVERTVARPSSIVAKTAEEQSPPDLSRADFARLDSVWAAERVDEEWTENTETFFAAMLEAREVSPEAIQRVECGQTLCKVSFNTVDPKGVYGLGRQLASEGVPFVVSIGAGDGGAPAFVAFLAKDENPAALVQ